MFVPEIELKNIEDWTKIAGRARVRVFQENRYNNNRLINCVFQCFDGIAVYTLKVDWSKTFNEVKQKFDLPDYREYEYMKYHQHPKPEKEIKEYEEKLEKVRRETDKKCDQLIADLKAKFPMVEGRFTSVVIVAEGR